MTKRDDYAVSIAGFLSPGFKFGELVSWHPTRRRALPPRELQPNIVPALILANTLRTRMIQRCVAFHGLRIRAAYRPKGGARNSQHKLNRALDLDLLPNDYALANVFYEESVRLWCEVGAEDGDHPVGLGLYCGPRSLGGIRVHLDVGLRARTWQGHGGGFIMPWNVDGKAVPLARHIASLHDWAPPVPEDDHTDAEAA